MTRAPNHLAGQTSPYLLQHLHNPVDWHPWGPEAHERARREDKPIFLSIGYAACHWCHVMERESFEDERVARFLSEHFVSIKVDREERPDVDEIYMNAVQILTRHGGWPLNVFLTPDLRPFYGGTYFPPEPRLGHPSFLDVVRQLAHAWKERRDEVLRAAEDLTRQVRLVGEGPAGDGIGGLDADEVLDGAARELASRFDSRRGGFGAAPKFPPDQSLALLLRHHRLRGDENSLRMALRTLDAMALGGMYDQVGGGFARYSVDDLWLVPHFEKMLYNQALLVPVYVDAWKITGRPLYRRVTDETLDFVRRELTGPDGGLYSSLDADSEGEEGRFYVWTPREVREVLGPDHGETFCRLYGIREEGNFEGRSIPNLLDGDLPDRAEGFGRTADDLGRWSSEARAKLLAARQERVRPGTDDKILAAWNGLAVTAFSRAFQAFRRPEDLRSARRAASFVLERMRDGGRLRVSWREGEARLNGYLDDYAFLARGLLDLYETSFERSWLDEAAGLARTLVERFEDRDHGGFFFVSDDHESLIARNRSFHDGALPSGNGVATEALLRIAGHLDDVELREAAGRALAAAAAAVRRAPSAFASVAIAAGARLGRGREIAIVGDLEDDRTAALVREVHGRYLPDRIVAAVSPSGNDGSLPLLAGKSTVADRPAAYVCRGYACKAPVTDPPELGRLLDDA